MSGGYAPIVTGHIMPIQTRSSGFQIPFFQGGSQVPSALMMRQGTYNGSYSGAGFHKGSASHTHPNELDFTTKKSSKDFHHHHHNIKPIHHLPFETEGSGLKKHRKKSKGKGFGP